MPVKIALVDDKSSNRNLLQEKLQRHQHFIITLVAVDGKDFLDKMAGIDEDKMPDVVLMDLEMPEMDGVAAIATGSSLYPEVKFVVLTTFDDEDKIFNAIKAGAFGYLLKDESGEQISEVLWQMYENGAGPVSPGIAFKMLQMFQKNDMQPSPGKTKNQSNFFQLSEREQEIIRLLAKGLGYKELGAQLGISVNTAKKHVINVYNKLHVNSRAHALRLAYEKGML